MITKAQLKAQRKYDTKNTKSYYIKLNKKNDADIIEKLDTVENRQGYIKNLIREDLHK